MADESSTPSARSLRPYRTAAEWVADRLRRSVLAGELPPGSRVLQATVAMEFGMSTTPVREALRDLATQGLLELDPHRGGVVPLGNVADLEEVYEIRILLEPVAIAATVRHITPAELQVASDLADRLEAERDVGEWVMLNANFHSVFVEAARMPILASILQKLRNISTIYIASILRHDVERLKRANLEHRRLIAAIANGDTKRAQEIELAHLEHTLQLGREQLTLLSPTKGPCG
jgi:DNA-binding GntR family transcriptional regulator